ncbi:MAG: sigma-70 family RNA polymerase sigma factor, partial [Deltaproteobacteria bacterium]|nr:sigma-70 family RNA polymerase sigma factor [Deltaproteobacteria bacterium]
NDQDEAEDVFQQVFLKLHRYRHRYRSEVPFLPWLFTITRNAMIDHIRRGKMDRCRAGDSEAILESLAAPAEEGADPGEILAQMTSLSEKQRQVLEMRFQQGWDFEEIAGYFQTSAVNARKMVSRAMAAIRKMKPS